MLLSSPTFAETLCPGAPAAAVYWSLVPQSSCSSEVSHEKIDNNAPFLQDFECWVGKYCIGVFRFLTDNLFCYDSPPVWKQLALIGESLCFPGWLSCWSAGLNSCCPHCLVSNRRKPGSTVEIHIFRSIWRGYKTLTSLLSPCSVCFGTRTKYVSIPFSSRYSHLSPPLPGSTSNSPCRLSLVLWEICTLLVRHRDFLQTKPKKGATKNKALILLHTPEFHRTPSCWPRWRLWTRHQTASASARALHRARCLCEHPRACPHPFLSFHERTCTKYKMWRPFLFHVVLKFS